MIPPINASYKGENVEVKITGLTVDPIDQIPNLVTVNLTATLTGIQDISRNEMRLLCQNPSGFEAVSFDHVSIASTAEIGFIARAQCDWATLQISVQKLIRKWLMAAK